MIDMTDLSLMGIEKSWLDWEGNQTKFERIDSHCIEISTSILNAFSNNIAFYLKEKNGLFTLTDLGETYQSIQENTSFNLNPDPIFKQIAKKYHAEFRENILSINSISTTNLAPTIQDFKLMIFELTILAN